MGSRVKNCVYIQEKNAANNYYTTNKPGTKLFWCRHPCPNQANKVAFCKEKFSFFISFYFRSFSHSGVGNDHLYSVIATKEDAKIALIYNHPFRWARFPICLDICFLFLIAVGIICINRTRYSLTYSRRRVTLAFVCFLFFRVTFLIKGPRNDLI